MRKELHIYNNFLHIRDVVEHSSVLINMKRIEIIHMKENEEINIITARGEIYSLPWSKFDEKLLIHKLETMGDRVEVHTDSEEPLSVVKVSYNGDSYEEEEE